MSSLLQKKRIKAYYCKGMRLLAPLFRKISTLDSSVARANLMNIWPTPSGIPTSNNTLLKPSVNLQIIVPAYNVEQYLEECINSVLSQKTTYSYHIIIIDDGSQDNTPAISDSFANHPNITVIHKENGGASSARNIALQNIFGEYLMFLDSDDILMDGALQTMLDTAYRYNSDLVEGGMDSVFETNTTNLYQFTKTEKVLNPYAILHGFPCGKVFRASLFENLCFPEKYYFEDSIISFLIFPCVNNAYVIPHICYGYRNNPLGIMRNSKGKVHSIDTYWITELLIHHYQLSDYSITEEFLHFILQQFRINQRRVSNLDIKIQESIFVLSCDLLEKYFPITMMDSANHQLLKTLRTRDFGQFKIYCKY